MASNFFAALDSDSEGEAPRPKQSGGSKGGKAATGSYSKGNKSTQNEGASGAPRKDRRDGERRGGAGARGGRGGGRSGKREFDRRSGTGRGREVRKGGAGAHGWGSEKAEAAKAERSSAVDAVRENGEAVNEDGAPVVEEEEDNTMTLAEFEKAKAAKRSGDAFAAREVASVDKDKDLAKHARHIKGVNEDDELSLVDARKERKRKTHKAERTHFDAKKLGFRVGERYEPRRDDRGDRGDRRNGGDRRGGDDRRGGRGGSRGGRGASRGGARGGGRGGARSGGARLAPAAFPSLGAVKK